MLATALMIPRAYMTLSKNTIKMARLLFHLEKARLGSVNWHPERNLLILLKNMEGAPGVI